MKRQNTTLGRLPLVALVGVLLFCTLNNASAQTVPQIAEKALAATVSLEMQDRNGEIIGFGSGFFVRYNLIATNYHVIEGAARGVAKLVDRNRTYTIEGITATDKANDLALLKVSVYGINPLLLGDSNMVRIGETVYVAGNPMGLEGTISDGIISGRRNRDTKERLQMTAPISPGSSGGPVLNNKGEVIGISVATYRGLDVQNLNFAIPSNALKALLTQSQIAKSLSEGKRPISAETYFIRGIEKGKLGDYKKAIADFTQAIRLQPDYADAYYNRGVAKARLGGHRSAITDYDMAIRLQPDYVDAYIGRGNAKARLREYFSAIKDYDTAIHLKPDFAKAYYNRGVAKDHLKEYFSAIADYDMAIRLQPDYVDAYIGRGNAKARLGKNLSAIKDFDMAIHLKPDFAKAYYNRGVAKDYLKKYLSAIADYDMAIRLQPGYADAYINRGNAKARLGENLSAIKDYDRVIHLKPNYADAYYNRGIAKGRLKRFKEAKQDLMTAWKIAEQNGDERLKAQIEALLQQ